MVIAAQKDVRNTDWESHCERMRCEGLFAFAGSQTHIRRI